MSNIKALPAEELRAECKAEEFDRFQTESTDEDGIIGQERALQALQFGLGIESVGFNLYVAGAPGTGKETAVKDYVEKVAQKAPVPPDLCYVNNFKDPYRPRGIKLPPGKGVELARDMKNLIEAARSEIPRAFESDEFIAQKEKLTKGYNEQKQKLFNQLNEKAMEKGLFIQSTPAGFLFVPRKEDGTPMEEQELMSLSEEERNAIYEKKSTLEDELKSIMREARNIDRKANEEIQELERQVALFAVEHLFNDLKEKYRDVPEVISYFKSAQEDVIENVNLFRQGDDKAQQQQQQQQPFPFASMSLPWSQLPQFKKYEVNVIVDNSRCEGAPVIIERNPTYNNVLGRIEKEAQFGALMTDFTMIRGGSLHQANEGFLVITAEELLKNPLTWESLKRVLKGGQLEIEEPGEKFGFISTKTLRPEPVPLTVKVILIGAHFLYYLLYNYDQDFRELFKVKAEFDVVMERNEQTTKKYHGFITSFCQKEECLPLDSSAMAKIVEYGSRLADDQQKLSTRFAEIADVVREASYYAAADSYSKVSAEHINTAIEAKLYRSNLVQEKLQEAVERKQLLIDTEGEKVGQANGLSVSSVGDFSFGRPLRITCSTGLGRDGIVDIEREARLGGRIHSKGVLILGGFLADRYSREMPLTLSARLVMEQSYGEVEGDSASSVELYALLSALAELPLRQDLAVTGSVNQKGQVQAIGGVNEKIEGFFELCRSRGLNGKQGALIPASNKQNLMLKEEVVEAVKEGKFHIFPVRTIDEGIELLTGKKAGQRRENGSYEEGTVNYLVEKALHSNVEKMKKFAADKERKNNEEGEGPEAGSDKT